MGLGQPKRCLGQIVSNAVSGTNCFKSGVWDKLFQKRCLGQIVSKAVSGIDVGEVIGEVVGSSFE